MGILWIAQIRILYLALLLAALVYLLYASKYILRLQEQEQRVILTSTKSSIHNENEFLAAVPAIVTTSLTTISVQSYLLESGVAAGTIYEGGHVGVSSDICPDFGKKVQLFIAITSAPSHQDARMDIRQTWGHYGSRRDIAIIFMLGTTSNQTLINEIKLEEYLYSDIITGKFIDTYDNLTLKTISILEFVYNYCPNANFVLKTDDDMFINVHRLLTFISKHKPEQRNIYGRVAKKWKPFRNYSSKYYISEQQYKLDIFPDFTTGPAYLLPARLVKDLYTAALNHTFFKLEDVFVTGFVANHLKIKRVHAPEFFNERILPSACLLKRSISIHTVRGSEQYKLWRTHLVGLARCI